MRERTACDKRRCLNALFVVPIPYNNILCRFCIALLNGGTIIKKNIYIYSVVLSHILLRPRRYNIRRLDRLSIYPYPATHIIHLRRFHC